MGQNELGQLGEFVGRTQDPISDFAMLADFVPFFPCQCPDFIQDRIGNPDLPDVVHQARDFDFVDLAAVEMQFRRDGFANLADAARMIHLATVFLIERIHDDVDGLAEDA